MSNAARKARKKAGEKFQPTDHLHIPKRPHNPPKPFRTVEHEDIFNELISTEAGAKMARALGWIR